VAQKHNEYPQAQVALRLAHLWLLAKVADSPEVGPLIQRYFAR
jgi:hypothetical protein